MKENKKFVELKKIGFKDFSSFQNLEKDLENFLAANLFGTLFEDARLMPIFQERHWQEEADIYALDRAGNLVIFELKRSTAGEEALHQALRYAQEAGRWRYETLQEKYRTYSKNPACDLRADHYSNFADDISHPLAPQEFNRDQQLRIVGSALDTPLVDAVDYWQHQGIDIDFLPYRIYEIGGKQYFEFFAKPYDRHLNPAMRKGVLFDTNRTYNEQSIWQMFKAKQVQAYGEAKRFIDYLNKDDYVFFSHKSWGIVAAARLKTGKRIEVDEETWAKDIEFLTPVPKSDVELRALPFADVSAVTGVSFFWARTIKVPYLNMEEAEKLLLALIAATGTSKKSN